MQQLERKCEAVRGGWKLSCGKAAFFKYDMCQCRLYDSLLYKNLVKMIEKHFWIVNGYVFS